ncbi:MAG TPA: hypothetical protein VES95_08055 [Dermatophilaceae bacterium]|nr:hypothetical protein [Dermatophilaceae bacterium]
MTMRIVPVTGVAASGAHAAVRGGPLSAVATLRFRGTGAPTAALRGPDGALASTQDVVFTHLQASLPS